MGKKGNKVTRVEEAKGGGGGGGGGEGEAKGVTKQDTSSVTTSIGGQVTKKTIVDRTAVVGEERCLGSGVHLRRQHTANTASSSSSRQRQLFPQISRTQTNHSALVPSSDRSDEGGGGTRRLLFRQRSSAQRSLLMARDSPAPSPRTRVARGSAKANTDLLGVDRLVPSSDIPHFGNLLSSLKEQDKSVRFDTEEGYGVQHGTINSYVRAQLFDWILEVGHEYSLKRGTVQMAVIFTDNFLSVTKQFPSKKVQLLAITALATAAKLEEIYPPAIRDFSVTTDGLCTGAEIVQTEKSLLKVLGWNLFPTTYVQWIEFILHDLFQATKRGKCDEGNSGPEERRRTSSMAMNQKPADGRLYQSRECRSAEEERLIAVTNDLLDVAILDMKILTFTRATVSAAALALVIRELEEHESAQEKMLGIENVVRGVVDPSDFRECYHWLEDDIQDFPRECVKRKGSRAPKTKYKEQDLQSYNRGALAFIQIVVQGAEDDESADVGGEVEEAVVLDEEGEEEEEEVDEDESDDSDDEKESDVDDAEEIAARSPIASPLDSSREALTKNRVQDVVVGVEAEMSGEDKSTRSIVDSFVISGNGSERTLTTGGGNIEDLKRARSSSITSSAQDVSASVRMRHNEVFDAQRCVINVSSPVPAHGQSLKEVKNVATFTLDQRKAKRKFVDVDASDPESDVSFVDGEKRCVRQKMSSWSADKKTREGDDGGGEGEGEAAGGGKLVDDVASTKKKKRKTEKHVADESSLRTSEQLEVF